MKRTLAMLLALALLLLCACSAAPEPTQPAAEPPVETAETLPGHAAQDDAAPEPAQPLFWQVSGNGYSGSFYLLGSIHVSDGLTYPQELLDAYAACDTLAVESDVLALEADLSAQVEMMRCLVYTDGTTIDAHLDAQTYADAKQVLTDLGGYQTMLDHYMPIFWYLLAGNLALAQTRFSPDGGVDRYFLQMAKADGTEILEVEQYTDVYRALGALSEETQVYALQQAIRPEVLAATEEDAAALLGQNRNRFALENLQVVCGSAPEACVGLPAPTHAFIGGSAGNMHEIVALLLAKSDVYDEMEAKLTCQGVFTLAKPTSALLLNQSLKWLVSARERLRRMEEKATSVEEKMEEIRLVNRAKWLLIEQLKMTEAEAHRHIEKQAMDRCTTRREIALGIIKTYA